MNRARGTMPLDTEEGQYSPSGEEGPTQLQGYSGGWKNLMTTKGNNAAATTDPSGCQAEEMKRLMRGGLTTVIEMRNQASKTQK